MTAPPPPGSPATTMAEAVNRMEAIDAALPPSDGLAVFNHMYLGITLDVEGKVGQGYFADAAFMAHLDVVFANLYFDAVDALTATPGDLPAAWAPLLERRGDPAIEPIQFALAGMNAHINHDLPQAVVATCSQLGTYPDEGQHHGDYQKVDALLAEAEQAIRQSFESGVVLSADRHLQAVANVVANWSITSAREVAWDTAQALWALRRVGMAEHVLLTSLGRTVGMAGWGLLAAV